jgi:hypothetical protein
MTEGANEIGSVRQLDLHVGSVSGVLIYAESLDRFARELGAFDVIILHESPNSLLDSHIWNRRCHVKTCKYFRTPIGFVAVVLRRPGWTRSGKQHTHRV